MHTYIMQNAFTHSHNKKYAIWTFITTNTILNVTLKLEISSWCNKLFMIN